MAEIAVYYVGFGFIQWMVLISHPEMLKPGNFLTTIFLWPLVWAFVFMRK